MNKFLKKNLVLLVSIAIVLVLWSSLMVLNSKSKEGSFKIVNRYGDERLLKGLEIQGRLHNDYFDIDFKLKDGKDEQKLIYYNNDKAHIDKSYINRLYSMGSLYTKDRTYSMRIETHVTTLKDGIMGCYGEIDIYNNDNSKSQHIPFRPEVIPQTSSAFYKFQFMAEVGDKLYFVIPTVQGDKGSSGLYEVNVSKGKGNKNQLRKLESISLEEGKVEVMGMVAVKDKLAVIHRRYDRVILKSYDLKTEKFIDEIEISSPKGITSPGSIYNLGAYVSSNKLMLPTTDFDEGVNIHIFDLSDKISFVGSVDLKEKNLRIEKLDMIYKNDMLYIIVENIVFPEINETNENLVRVTPDYYLQLYVYDNKANMKYSGRLISDINDDNLWQLKPDTYDAKAGKAYPYRRYEYINLE